MSLALEDIYNLHLEVYGKEPFFFDEIKNINNWEGSSTACMSKV